MAPAPEFRDPGADSGSDHIGSAPAPGKKRRLQAAPTPYINIFYFELLKSELIILYTSFLDHIYRYKLLSGHVLRHVDVGDSGHLAAAVLALAAGGDLFESEGMGGQQRHHGDEEPQGVAPSPVPHHVAGSHNIPVLLCGDGPDVTVSSREEECYGCEGEVDHVEDQLLGAGHGGGQAQQHTHSHSPRQYAYNKCMKL